MFYFSKRMFLTLSDKTFKTSHDIINSRSTVNNRLQSKILDEYIPLIRICRRNVFLLDKCDNRFFVKHYFFN